MARKSDKLEALCQVRKEELIADIMRGELSWRALSSKYDVPEATLRSFADRSQIQRNPTGAKREMVAAKMALPDHSAQPAQTGPAQSAQSAHESAQRADSATGLVTSTLEAAADEDVRDMRFGLQAARMALTIVGKKLQAGVINHSQLAPRDIKSLSESIALNISTIRAVRGLDAAPSDLSKLTDAQLEALASGKKAS